MLPRLLLLLVVAAFVLLAANASLLTPLFEPLGEHEQLAVAQAFARGGLGQGPVPLEPGALRPELEPPLVPFVTALAMRALGLDAVTFLPRPRPGAGPRDAAAFLHGADELYPWTDPVRAFHALRLLGVLAGAVAVAATARLSARLAPGRPLVAVAAAALVAFNPAFVHLSGSLSAAPWGAALTTLSLVGLVGLAQGRARSKAGAFGLGALVGAAVLAHASAALLLPLAAAALLVRRRARAQPSALADRLAAGVLLTAGAWLVVNSLAHGALLGARWLAPAGPADTSLVELATALVARLGWHLDAGPVVRVLWIGAAGGALLGALGWRRGALAGKGTAWGLALGALALVVAALFVLAVGDDPLRRGALFLVWPVAACVLAVGWSVWVPRPVGAAGLLALGAACLWSQQTTLARAFWPPSRVHDPHFMAIDPIEGVPIGQRVATVEIVAPPDGALLLEAPRLRWKGSDDRGARYTVRLTAPGLGLDLRTYEDHGLALSDRFDVPEAFWDRLPSGAQLLCQIVRLPTLREVVTTPPEQRRVELSAVLTVRRERPEDRL